MVIPVSAVDCPNLGKKSGIEAFMMAFCFVIFYFTNNVGRIETGSACPYGVSRAARLRLGRKGHI